MQQHLDIAEKCPAFTHVKEDDGGMKIDDLFDVKNRFLPVREAANITSPCTDKEVTSRSKDLNLIWGRILVLARTSHTHREPSMEPLTKFDTCLSDVSNATACIVRLSLPEEASERA